MASTSQIKPIKSDNEIDTFVNTKYLGERRKGFVEVGEEKICLPVYYQKYKDEIDNFEVRNDDVYICAFPKTGTTWATDLLWLLYNNFDYESFKTGKMFLRVHQLEFISLLDLTNCSWAFPNYENFDYINNLKSPRLIKSHLHWSILPKQIRDGTKTPKIIVTLRSPQDTCLSYYHYSKKIEYFSGNLEEWCELFFAGRISLGPYWSNVLGYWHEKHRSNILFVKYTDMKKNLPAQIKRIAKFLNKDVSDDKAKELAEFLSAKNIQEIKQNYKGLVSTEFAKIIKDVQFVRKGEVGTSDKEMSPEILKRFEEWNAKHLAGEDISFC